jgi:hypothetical protein
MWTPLRFLMAMLAAFLMMVGSLSAPQVRLEAAGWPTTWQVPEEGSTVAFKDVPENPFLAEIETLDKYPQEVVEPVLDLASQGQIGGALQAMYQSAERDPRLANCHALAHEVGRLAALTDQDSDTLMSLADNRCNFGFMHSLLKWRLVTMSTHEQAIEAVGALCEQNVGSRKASWVGECLHGSGHAAWARTWGDAQRSWDLFCSRLPEMAISACATGVAMEWAGAYESRNLWVVPSVESNPLDLCRIFPLPYGVECVRFVAGPALYPPGYGMDPQFDERANIIKMLKWCASSPWGSSSYATARCQGQLGNAIIGLEATVLGWRELQRETSDVEALDVFIALAVQRFAIVYGRSQAGQLCALLDLTARQCAHAKANLPDGAQFG